MAPCQPITHSVEYYSLLYALRYHGHCETSEIIQGLLDVMKMKYIAATLRAC